MSDTKKTVSDRLTDAAARADELHTHGADGVHPMSKILFGWAEYKHIGSVFFWGLIALALLLVAVDIGLDRHEYFKFAKATGFYGIYGFAAFAFVVLMGWPLGKLLRRSPDYYGDEDLPPADIDPDLDIPRGEIH